MSHSNVQDMLKEVGWHVILTGIGGDASALSLDPPLV